LEVQLSAIAMSHDGLHDLDILAVLGASLSLGMSALPWNGPIGAIRIGRVDERFVLNPNLDEQERSTMDLVVAGKKGSILMVESGAFELSEEMLVEALTIAQTEIDRLCDLQNELFKRASAKPRWPPRPPRFPPICRHKVNELARGRFKEAVRTAEKAPGKRWCRPFKKT
jgi:polyribonucleotide nucleotidyltransferase